MPNWMVDTTHGKHGQFCTTVTAYGSIHYGRVSTTRQFQVMNNNISKLVTITYYNFNRNISASDVDFDTLLWLEKVHGFSQIKKRFYS